MTEQGAAVTLAAIRQRWLEMLHELYKLNNSAPIVVELMRAARLEGDTLVLYTDQRDVYEKFQPTNEYGEKRVTVVQRALQHVHGKALVVRVEYVEKMN
jgi:hypothetical protein